MNLVPAVNQLDGLVLPMVDMTLPALRALSPAQYQEFSKCFIQLVQADKRLGLFEWTLHQILLRHLRPQFETAAGWPSRSTLNSNLILFGAHPAASYCRPRRSGIGEDLRSVLAAELGREVWRHEARRLAGGRGACRRISPLARGAKRPPPDFRQPNRSRHGNRDHRHSRADRPRGADLHPHPQQHDRQPQSGRRGVERHRRAAQATPRPGPQPGRDGEGLRDPRERGLREGDQGPRRRDVGARGWRDRAGRAEADRGADRPAGRGRELPDSCAPPRTSSSCRATSPSSRTRSRPRGGSTTPTCSPTTRRSRCSRTRSSPTRVVSRRRSSSRSRTPASASRSRFRSTSRRSVSVT